MFFMTKLLLFVTFGILTAKHVTLKLTNNTDTENSTKYDDKNVLFNDIKPDPSIWYYITTTSNIIGSVLFIAAILFSLCYNRYRNICRVFRNFAFRLIRRPHRHDVEHVTKYRVSEEQIEEAQVERLQIQIVQAEEEYVEVDEELEIFFVQIETSPVAPAA